MGANCVHFGGMRCDKTPRITLNHADIDRIFRQRYKYDEVNEERTRKLPRKPFTVNISLKRELAINTREGIIRNNFYLNSFACCPREIRKFVFSFFQKKLLAKEHFELSTSSEYARRVFSVKTSNSFTMLRMPGRAKPRESQVFVKWLSKINFMQNAPLYCDPQK